MKFDVVIDTTPKRTAFKLNENLLLIPNNKSFYYIFICYIE